MVEEKLFRELVDELKLIREEMQKQKEMLNNISEDIVEELRGIKNEVSH